MQRHDPSARDGGNLNPNKGNFLSKFNPLKGNDESQDIETTAGDVLNTQGSAASGGKAGGGGGGLMSMFKKQPPVEKPIPTTFTGKMIAKLPEESDKIRAMMFFGIAALFCLLALMNIFAILISPGKFTCTFTLAVILGMIGLCLWNGP